MRAEVERNTAAGSDAWTGPAAPAFTPLATIPCWMWWQSGRELRDGTKTAGVDDARAMMPLGSDIAEGDEIARVTDRSGSEIIAGRFRVDAPPQRKHRHIEIVLKRIV